MALAGTLLTPLAAAATPGVDEISIVDGRTAPVFGYADAIRERVFIPVAGVDQDLDGTDDVTAIDIIRPLASDGGLQVPAIIDPSPYYTTIGRGNEGEHIKDLDADGINDVWPLYVDNYFVPRGYAVILAQMNGTGNSTGCPMHGGPGDIASMRVVIDWLQGRVEGRDGSGNLVTADWHNGKAAMIGKSYDGTLANGVAATGVAGLTTIVPQDAISDWYRYSRTNGIRHNSNYPSGLAFNVTNSDRRMLCSPTRDQLDLQDGDDTGDVNAFWSERDYTQNVSNITASVFAVQGLNDDNVEMDQFGDYWEALKANGVARKVWLMKVGHIDPFDSRREAWVDALHRWFDYWLYDIPNGIMEEPLATVETDPGVYEDVADWPLPGTVDVPVHLAGTVAGSAGALLLEPGSGAPSVAFTGPSSSMNENTLLATPEGSQAARLAFLSAPLTTELRISGTPRIELDAALSTPQSNLSVVLVDYGTTTRTSRGSDGMQNTTVTTCWGDASVDDDACYLEKERNTTTTDRWRVSRGGLDSSNRDSLLAGQATPVTPGQLEDFDWDLLPYDHTFPVGHRIGVLLTTRLSSLYNNDGTPSVTVTVDATTSRILLPIVGGLPAAAAAEGLGEVDPVNLAFDLGGHGSAIAAQSVAYGHAPVLPAAPVEPGWVFRGWYTDATFATTYDFGATLYADATAYARWEALADAVETLEIVPSSTSVDQGDTITFVVNGFDDTGAPLGDVTSFATVESSITSDEITNDPVTGGTITFVHASPHLITASLGTAVITVSVWVEPAAIVVPAADGALGATGAEVPMPLLAGGALLLLLGAALTIAAMLRRRKDAGV